MKELETNNYSVKPFLTAFSYNGLRTYGLIESFVKYNFPEVVCNAPKEKSPEDVIERLHLDYIGDNEVDGFIRSVILECRTIAKIKKRLSSAFPCAKRKHPSWVQEAE